MNQQPVHANLTGVPETMLWTLHNRATEAQRSDGILQDPRCVEIYNSIQYDFQRSFGKADPSHAVRSVLFDNAILDFLKIYPQGIIVSLGEGLETEVLRCDNGTNRWLSIDLPESIAVRERFIQPTPRFRHLAKSALDLSWLNELTDEPVFIAAQGLFMYFEEHEVQNLLVAINLKFSNYTLMFDTVPRWFSKMTLKGLKKTPYYTTPKMPWGINANEIKPKIHEWLPRSVSVQNIPYKFPRGFWKAFVTVFNLIPVLRQKKPCMVLVKASLFKANVRPPRSNAFGS